MAPQGMMVSLSLLRTQLWEKEVRYSELRGGSPQMERSTPPLFPQICLLLRTETLRDPHL